MHHFSLVWVLTSQWLKLISPATHSFADPAEPGQIPLKGLEWGALASWRLLELVEALVLPLCSCDRHHPSGAGYGMTDSITVTWYFPDAQGWGWSSAPPVPCVLSGLWDRSQLPGLALPHSLESLQNIFHLRSAQLMLSPDNLPHCIFSGKDHTVLTAPGSPLTLSHYV